MSYNLTDTQKDLARLLVDQARTNKLPEEFRADVCQSGQIRLSFFANGDHQYLDVKGTIGALDALAESKMLLQRITYQTSETRGGSYQYESNRNCTLTGLIYSAVDSDFVETETPTPISTLAQPHPPEIAMSLDRLRTKYPDPKKLGFLVMRFEAAKPFQRIVEIIKKTAEQNGVTVIRADENEFHADLWGNVRTHLHGCGFGIAVYERIETEEPNVNVGLEIGYLMAMNKPVLLLKDKTVPTLQADLAGKLYKPFDPHDPDGTIPGQLEKWLEDNGIVVPKRGATP